METVAGEKSKFFILLVTFNFTLKQNFKQTNVWNLELQLDEFLIYGDEAWGEDSEVKRPLLCGACATAVDEILTVIDEGASPDVIFNMTVDFCVDFNISTYVFCENFIEIAKVIIYNRY